MLTDKDKEKAIEELKNYKYSYCCRFCKVIYGSDFPNDDGICTKCSLKSSKKRGNKNE